MDIDLLSKMIGELILDHDELSLPGLGTFVAEEVPASFSDRGYTVNPPYRKLSFYQRPENDHLLIDFYASSNNVSFQDASLIIVRFLDEMKTLLKEKKVIVMPGLGRLRATRENNFFFVPDADLDIYPDGFGLRSVSMKNHTESQAELSSAVGKLSGMLFSEPAAEPDTETVFPVAEPSATSNPAPAQQPAEEEAKEPTAPAVEETAEAAVEEKKEENPAMAAEEAKIAAEEIKEAAVEEKKEENPATAAEEAKIAAEEIKEAAVEKKENENEPAEESVEVIPKGVKDPVEEKKEEKKKEEKIEKKKEEKKEEKKKEEKKKEEKKEEKKDRAEEDRKESTKSGTGLAGGLKVLIGAAVLAVVALGVFLLLAHVAPDFIDSLLYTPEELEILNYPLD